MLANKLIDCFFRSNPSERGLDSESPRESKPKGGEMRKEAIFDGIRGLAFLIVLALHVLVASYPLSLPYILGTPKYGVWLFFVLSSFLLTHNYLETGESKRDFISGRVIRIIPLYWVACFAYGITGIAVTVADIPSIALARWAGLDMWTIPVEFYFYGFLLALWLIRSVKARDLIFATVSLVSMIALILANKLGSSPNTLWYLPAFFVGYALARLWPSLPGPKHGQLIAIGVLAILLVASPWFLWCVLGIQASGYLLNAYAPIALLWGIFIWATVKPSGGIVYAAMQSKPMVFLRRISYSGYLFHALVLIYLQKILGSGWLVLAAGPAGSIIAGWVSYRLLERPVLKLRRRLTRASLFLGKPNRSPIASGNRPAG